MGAVWHYVLRSPTGFILLNATLWWLAQIIARPGLDSYGDMVEVYAWSQHWLMGSDKHPQLLPWIAKIWFWVAPHSVISFYLLAAMNLVVGMFGIAKLGRAAGLKREEVLVALALQSLAFPYLTLPAKLNMNAILLALWPWVTHAFLRVTQTNGRPQKLWAVWLGIIASAAVFAKYYSLVLLAGLLIASLTPRLRALWRGATPLIFIAVLLIALTPHMFWLTNHSDSLGYAASQGDNGINLRYLATFALSPLLYWPVPIVLALRGLYHGHLWNRLRSLLRMQTGDEVLWMSAVSPLILTLLFGLTGKAELSLPWTIPIGFAFTLLMLRNRTRDQLGKLPSAFPFIWIGLLLLSMVYTMSNGVRGKTWHYMPEAASTELILEGWRKLNPDMLQLSWAASGNAAARLIFFSPEGSRPEALPTLPDRLPDYYPVRLGWQSEAGVIICAIREGQLLVADKACQLAATKWAVSHGLQSELFSDQTHRSGWRFPRIVPFKVSAVFVWPK